MQEDNAYITFTAIIDGFHIKENRVCRLDNFGWSGISSYAKELKDELQSKEVVIINAFRLREE